MRLLVSSGRSTRVMLVSAYQPSRPQMVQVVGGASTSWVHGRSTHRRRGSSWHGGHLPHRSTLHPGHSLHGTRTTGFCSASPCSARSSFTFFLAFVLVINFSFFSPGQTSRGLPVTDCSALSFLWVSTIVLMSLMISTGSVTSLGTFFLVWRGEGRWSGGLTWSPAARG